MPYLIKMFFYLQIKLYQSRNPNCFKCNDVKTIRKKRHLGMTLRAKKKKKIAANQNYSNTINLAIIIRCIFILFIIKSV